MSTLGFRRGIRIATVTCLTLLLALVASLGSPPSNEAPASTSKNPFIIHEWGTFLSVQGSDGVTLGGMVDSDEPLPSFVEERSISAWKRSMFRQKGETPVTYFYTDRPMDVQVRVDMPKGILTHWYPPVCRFGPNPTAKAATAPTSSYLDWCTVHLHPATQSFAKTVETNGNGKLALSLQKVGLDQPWRFARETDSAIVRVESHDTKGNVVSHMEKFLFYRGVGTFPMPLEAKSRDDDKTGLHLILNNHQNLSLHGMYAVQVENNLIRFAALPDLAGNSSGKLDMGSIPSAPLPLSEGVAEVKSAVAATLMAAGLYPKEAQAMVNNWERSYFRTEGLRILYVVPRETVDGVLPIQFRPKPDKLVRVMLGRVELLTPQRENQIEKFVGDLGAKDFKLREAASAGLGRLGRLGEPALRRVMNTTKDPEVRARADSLIQRIAAGS